MRLSIGIVFILGFVLVLAAVQWFNRTQNLDLIAKRCEIRVEATVDPTALQDWATNLLSHYSVAKTNYGGPFPPFPALAGIWEGGRPSAFILGGDHGEEEFVCISWGASAGHWGLSVGRQSFIPLIPEHGKQLWKPGIYFWHQFH